MFKNWGAWAHINEAYDQAVLKKIQNLRWLNENKFIKILNPRFGYNIAYWEIYKQFLKDQSF